MTLAETISRRYYSDDGQVWRDADGVALEDALETAGAMRERSNEHSAERYTLPDGSVITMQGGGWDYGYPDCWCWQGAGHTEDCEAA